MKNKKEEELAPLSSNEMMEFLDGVIEQYKSAVEKHPAYAPIVINPAASLDWVRENLTNARAYLKHELSADHVNNCEWMESLEAWKMAMESKNLKELKENQKNFDIETKQVIATMIRYWQLGMKTIIKHKLELEGKKGK